MSPLRSALKDYLGVRRQLGFALQIDGRQLEGFIGFLEAAGAPRITTELAVAWAKLPTGTHPQWWRARLGMVRGFARYLNTIDPDSEIPPRDLLSAKRSRVTPYLYSQAEITALMVAARALTPPPLRGRTCETVIGLMAASGLRTGETIGLDRADVDLNDGALHVRAGKRSKQREVPLHESTTEALREYSRLRDRYLPKPDTQAFFLSTRGSRVTNAAVNEMFPKLLRDIGLEDGGERRRPRPHDLRHTFAVRTLLDWYRAGVNVDAQLPLLSTYLGHAQPSDTYWYLQAAPELLALAGQRLNGVLGAWS
jgi:integrase/recombinase XerD